MPNLAVILFIVQAESELRSLEINEDSMTQGECAEQYNFRKSENFDH